MPFALKQFPGKDIYLVEEAVVRWLDAQGSRVVKGRSTIHYCIVAWFSGEPAVMLRFQPADSAAAELFRRNGAEEEQS